MVWPDMQCHGKDDYPEKKLSLGLEKLRLQLLLFIGFIKTLVNLKTVFSTTHRILFLIFRK